MRDLTYVIAGIIILMSGKYAFDIDLINYFESSFGLSESLYKLILLLIISYFIGLIAKEALVYKYRKENCVFWFNTLTPTIDDYGRDGFLRFIKDVRDKYNSLTVRHLERVVYFYHIAASIGIASFISFILLLLALIFNRIDISSENIILTIIMGLIVISCIIQNNKKWDEYNRFLKDMNQNMEKPYNFCRNCGSDLRN
jgi:hypothetical protein